jgi:hypothetical protein
MHTCFAITTKGTPLGLFDQKIFARELRPKKNRFGKGKRYVKDVLPIEDKESYRWIKSLEATSKLSLSDKTQIVTVCDRECDFYDFFKSAEKNDSAVLVRASQNRTVNRGSRYAEKDVSKLWDHIMSKPAAGYYYVDISAKQKTKHCKGRIARTAKMEVKFGEFKMNPPRNNPKHSLTFRCMLFMYLKCIPLKEKTPWNGCLSPINQ